MRVDTKDMFCKHCGREARKEERFCKNCGTALGAGGTPVFGSTPIRQPRWLNTLVIVLIILTVGGIVALFVRTGSEHAADNLLSELNPSIESVGHFVDPSFFDDENIAYDEWLAHIEYTRPMYATPLSAGNIQFPDQHRTYAAVVKIVCKDTHYYYYGSGTNVDPAGYVLTNLHVIEDGVSGLECVVGFPDPSSGRIREAYYATPIVDEGHTTGHDLALLSVEQPVFDADHRVYGFYERLEGWFPYYEETAACLETAPELGDHIFVIGYPTLSGGALTVTDGLVSSLYSADGYLITSAKISEGNSGGLAVDTNGCFVGVPTAVYSGSETEHYGEIIDAQFVYEFYEAVGDDIDEYTGVSGDIDWPLFE